MPINSINTNASSLYGLQELNKSSGYLSKTQNTLSSGKSVSSVKDNAAIFSVAKSLESNLAGNDAVQMSLDRGISTVDVSLAAGGIVSDLLLQLKEKAVSASDPGLDDDSRRALNEEFTVLRDQITSTLDSASFNGTNALKSGGDDVTVLTNETGSENLTVDNQGYSLGGETITLSEDATILNAEDAGAVVAALEDSIENVTSSLSELGAASTRLENLKGFTQKQSDAVNAGVGNLVDADIGKTAAALAAQEVKQALGVTTQNIANQSQRNILALFK